MSQLSLLPIRLVDEQPADRSQSKDLAWIGIDEQDRKYALKTVEPAARYLPLIEWLCYHLCQHCGIPAPEFAIVIRLDGSKAFGSRWANGAWQVDPAQSNLHELVLRIDRAKHDVSAMLALDAFMPNEDRHFGNILFTHTGARARALAFDWSRTQLFDPWPWPPSCNSERAWHWLRAVGLTDPAAAQSTLDRVAALSETELERILTGAPPEWTRDLDIAATKKWWRDNKALRAAAAASLLLP